MAEEIIFKTSVDTGTTAKDLQAIDKELGNIDKTTKSTSNDLNKTFDDLNKRVESGTMSMRESTQAIKQYQTIALQAGRESPIGKEALQRAGDLKDKLGDLKTEINNLGTDGANMKAALQLGSTITAGYGALTGVQALLGKESENLTKTLVKLQAVQAILAALEEVRGALEKESFLMQKAKIIQTNVLSAATAAYTTVVGTSTGAMKAMRIAMLGIPVVALVAGIAAISGALYNYSKNSKIAEEAEKKRLATLKAQDEAQKRYSDNLAKEIIDVKILAEQIKMSEPNSKKRVELINEMNSKYGTHLTNIKDETLFTKQLNEQVKNYIKLAEARIRATLAEENATKFISRENELLAKSNRLKKEAGDIDAFATKNAQGLYELNKANEQISIARLSSKEQDIALAKRDEQRKKVESMNESIRLKQQADDAARYAENYLQSSAKYAMATETTTTAIDNNTNATKTNTNAKDDSLNKIQELRNQDFELYKRELEEGHAMQEAEDAWKLEQELSAEEAQRLKDEKTRADEEEMSAWRIGIWEKTAAEEERIEKEKADNKKKIRDLNIQATTDSLTTLSNLAQLFAGKDKESQKRAFNIQKAVSVAQATIDTYKGATAALASGSAINPVYGFASAAAVVTAGLLNVRKILSQKFEGGGDTSSTSVQPPSTQVNEPNPQLANADTTITSTIGQGKANLGKVYVVDSEITAKQNATANTLSIATVG